MLMPPSSIYSGVTYVYNNKGFIDKFISYSDGTKWQLWIQWCWLIHHEMLFTKQKLLWIWTDKYSIFANKNIYNIIDKYWYNFSNWFDSSHDYNMCKSIILFFSQKWNCPIILERIIAFKYVLYTYLRILSIVN